MFPEDTCELEADADGTPLRVKDLLQKLSTLTGVVETMDLRRTWLRGELEYEWPLHGDAGFGFKSIRALRLLSRAFREIIYLSDESQRAPTGNAP